MNLIFKKSRISSRNAKWYLKRMTGNYVLLIGTALRHWLVINKAFNDIIPLLIFFLFQYVLRVIIACQSAKDPINILCTLHSFINADYIWSPTNSARRPAYLMCTYQVQWTVYPLTFSFYICISYKEKMW